MAVRNLTCLCTIVLEIARNSDEYIWRKLVAAPKLLGVIVSVETHLYGKLLSTVVPVVSGLLWMYNARELKVDVSKLNTTILRTPIFEWYVVMCERVF
jgi:hypothetical protein